MKTPPTLLFFLLLFPVLLNAQSPYRHNHKQKDKFYNERFSTDIHGNLNYQNQGFRATLSKDIFDNRIYKDSRHNEASYSKDIWEEAFSGFKGNERKILFWLINSFRGLENTKERYKRNIHGNFEYTYNDFKATLSKNIFDEAVFKDNFGNELKYSKEFWADIIEDFEGNEMEVFHWMNDQCRNKKNYKAEFKVDIFGYLQYKNSKGEKATLSKDIFDKIKYQDSVGSKIEFTEERWNKLTKRYGSQTRVFMSILSKSFLAEDYEID